MAIRAIIVEDEKMSREILSGYLAKYCPEIEIVGMAKDVREAIVLIRNQAFDLLFLDIELPFGNAFDVLEASRKEQVFETIFVTAYEKYAKEALNKHAAYYILKPISIDELIKAVDYVRQKLSTKQNPPQRENLSKISIADNASVSFIDLDQILYCQARDNYTEFVLKDKKILSSKSLSFYDKKMTPSGFCRIHRSFLINIECVEKYMKGSGGFVIMSNGDHLDVSNSKKAYFLKCFH